MQHGKIGLEGLRQGMVQSAKILLMCLGISLAAEAAAPTPQQLADAAWIAQGRTRFIATCSYCHGQEGDAGKTEPFRTHKGWDPLEIHDTIAEGKQDGANVMPPWKDSIPDEDIWKIVAYIHSLEGKSRQ